jgi:hypothetical protein
MLDRKEISAIIIVSLILGFTISLMRSIELFWYSLASILVIILINLTAKKVASFYVDSEIEIKLWEIKRFGFRPWMHFKKGFPAGVFFPIIFTALSTGLMTWFACLTFDVKAKKYRARKKYGIYSFSEMTEFHIAVIAAAGIAANLLAATMGYLVGMPEQMNFVKLNIYFAFFNMLPLSDLDGNKIFFGSQVIWSFLGAVVLAALGYAFWVI